MRVTFLWFFDRFEYLKRKPVDMHIAKSTAFFLMFVLMLSILISNVVNVINVDSYATTEQSQQHDSQQQSEPKKYQIADSTDNLIWFLQVINNINKIISFNFSAYRILIHRLNCLFLDLRHPHQYFPRPNQDNCISRILQRNCQCLQAIRCSCFR